MNFDLRRKDLGARLFLNRDRLYDDASDFEICNQSSNLFRKDRDSQTRGGRRLVAVTNYILHQFLIDLSVLIALRV